MNKKRTILFTHGGGRFANQLTNQAHFIAFAEENRQEYDVINLAFIPYDQYFTAPHICHDGLEGTFIARRIAHLVRATFATGRSHTISLLNQILRMIHIAGGMAPGCQSIKVGRVPNYIKYLFGKNVDTLEIQQYFSISSNGKKITLLAGWPIRCWGLFKKHQDVIRKKLVLNDNLFTNIRANVAVIREKHSAVVGVFIRQSDYRSWHNGKYYFTSEEYRGWMAQVRNVLNDRNVGFIVVTETSFEIDPEVKDYTYHLKTESGAMLNFAESMAVLTLCDYVMTPPSTFGIWAAFLGNVPIIPVYEKGQSISPSQFLTNNLFDAVTHPHMSVALR